MIPIMALITNDPMSYIYSLFLIWVISTLLLRAITKSRTRQPPSPMALPIVGHFHLLSAPVPKSLEALSLRYGPLMKIRFGSLSVYVVSNSDMAKQILQTQDVDFASKFEFGPSHHNIYLGSGFVNSSYGPYWRFMKKLCMTKLLAGPQLDRFAHIRERETTELLKLLAARSRAGEHCDLAMELTVMTNNMMCTMAMGKRCAENPKTAEEVSGLIHGIMESTTKMSFNDTFGPLRKLDLFGYGKGLRDALWRYDEFVENIIKEYHEGDKTNKSLDKEEEDVMDILLETQKDPDAEVKLTTVQIKFFFLELFLASIDTTTAIIKWAMAELINHPELMKKVREEIDRVVGTSRVVKETDVPNMPYLQAVMKETLRIHPPGPLLRRRCNKDTVLNGYLVKAGTNIMINTYQIMRDPERWPEPLRFDPERFLAGPPVELKGKDFGFMPFGSGRRGCMGIGHGSNVMYGTVAALVQCFDWKQKVGDKVNIDMAKGYGGTAQDLHLYPTTRLHDLINRY